MDERKYLVYLLTNMKNGKQYAGQTCSGLSYRWAQHRRQAKKGAETPLYRAIRRYEPENFSVKVLREGLTKEQADSEEILAIQVLHLMDDEFGYNLRGGGSSGKLKDAVRKKLSEIAKKRRNVNTQEIVRLYRSGLSMLQIADKLGISHRTVGKHLLAAKEPIRTTSATLSIRFGRNIDNDQISRLYANGMNTCEIGELLGIDSSAVFRRLDKHGVGTRPRSEIQRMRRGKGLDDGEVVRLYREGLSTTQIGRRFGVSCVAIRYRLKLIKEPLRPARQAARLRKIMDLGESDARVGI